MKILHKRMDVSLEGSVDQNKDQKLVMNGYTSFNFGSHGYFHLKFILSPSSNPTNNLMTMDICLNGYKEKDSNWDCKMLEYKFCVLQLKFFDIKSRLVLAKYIHISQEEGPACGCKLHDSHLCLNNDTMYLGHNIHDLDFKVSDESFCSLTQVRRLCQLTLEKRRPGSTFDVEKFEMWMDVQVFAGVRDKNSKKLVGSGNQPNSTWNPIFSDFKFKLLETGQVVRAHKFVLAAKSPVLKAKFDSEDILSDEIIQDPSISFDDLLAFVQILYDPTIDLAFPRMHPQTLLSRLKLAHKFGAIDLTNVYIRSLVGKANSKFNLKSIVSMYTVACQLGIGCLKFRCLQWMRVKKKLVRKSKRELQEMLQNSTLLESDKWDILTFNFPRIRTSTIDNNYNYDDDEDIIPFNNLSTKIQRRKDKKNQNGTTKPVDINIGSIDWIDHGDADVGLLKDQELFSITEIPRNMKPYTKILNNIFRSGDDCSFKSNSQTRSTELVPCKCLPIGTGEKIQKTCYHGTNCSNFNGHRSCPPGCGLTAGGKEIGAICLNQFFNLSEFHFRPTQDNLRLFVRPKIGVGILTTKRIEPYTHIGEYMGLVCKGESSREDLYVLDLSKLTPDWFISSDRCGNFTRYINCCKVRPTCIAFGFIDNGLPRVLLLTRRFVPAGYELTFDYGNTYDVPDPCGCFNCSRARDGIL